MEETSKRRPFFSSTEDLFDEEYYDEQSPEKKRRLTPEQVSSITLPPLKLSCLMRIEFQSVSVKLGSIEDTKHSCYNLIQTLAASNSFLTFIRKDMFRIK